ncbi:Cyclic nucleotide-gated ion channel [Corchorus olitorius]|uniref:Cyclic nucleotide-gated ion channel n=1 Tax=Corchorus olitorius TaxID=93759 RepID=A0A1R3FW26_9ROSI|nr:Cyclic nucleotide-gated ion channel [Corchorus olitorius]
MLNPVEPFSKGWDRLFLLSSVISVSLDPLFFYLPVVNEDKKCLFMDGKLGTVAIILRSVMDGLCIISVACRVFVPPENKRGNPATDAWSMTRSYFPSSFLLVEILAVLPLPQALGALWYFLAIERETACWLRACANTTNAGGSGSGSSLSLGATIYAARFAANALHARKARVAAERVPPILPQKPAEPDVTDEEL